MDIHRGCGSHLDLSEMDVKYKLKKLPVLVGPLSAIQPDGPTN